MKPHRRSLAALTVRALLLLPLAACSLTDTATLAPNPHTENPVAQSEVKALMRTQAEAWNRGDLRTFVSYYTDDMTFCGSRGVTRGTENLLANYQRSYPTAKERGQLTFELIEVRPLGSDSAMVLGKYKLAREEPTSGFFTLLVRRGASGLRIAHDHTSESPKPDSNGK